MQKGFKDKKKKRLDQYFTGFLLLSMTFAVVESVSVFTITLTGFSFWLTFFVFFSFSSFFFSLPNIFELNQCTVLGVALSSISGWVFTASHLFLPQECYFRTCWSHLSIWPSWVSNAIHVNIFKCSESISDIIQNAFSLYFLTSIISEQKDFPTGKLNIFFLIHTDISTYIGCNIPSEKFAWGCL